MNIMKSAEIEKSKGEMKMNENERLASVELARGGGLGRGNLAIPRHSNGRCDRYSLPRGRPRLFAIIYQAYAARRAVRRGAGSGLD